ncbi:hypothetical protein [Pectobacterium brasiliense]|uniref:hypothetical protein n=1 Tax=Pectobacterium brasiliense TaxID=180957 RepID=UPI000A480D4B|nr:hypothetical protein [Pectobacterium brasiliense]
MAVFFDSDEVKLLLSDYKKFIIDLNCDTEFEEKRNHHILNFLNNVISNPSNWDANSSINLAEISYDIKLTLAKKSGEKESIDFLFSQLFRIFTEVYFKSEFGWSDDFIDFKNFSIYRSDEFSEKSRLQINFAMKEMPFRIMKINYNSQDIKNFLEAAKIDGSISSRMNEWNEKLDNQIEKVEKLKESLDKQETAYNFVGLYKGFHNLSRAKRVEAKAALLNTRLFGILIIFPLIFEIFVLTEKINGTWSDAFRIALIPAFALTFIFVYYFRISLSNYQSIKSQIVQIELRKALCTFIQKYSEYAKEMKANDGASLEKFETIIFSNIMASEDKIPSTFDGIEQIAKLISSVKGK